MNDTTDLQCAACEQPFTPGSQATVVGRGQLVHAGCVKMFQAKLVGRVHKCPVCNGTGEVPNKDRPIMKEVRDHDAEQADAYNGSMYASRRYKEVVSGYEPMSCAACQGFGYWDHEPQPITKTEIVGYR